MKALIDFAKRYAEQAVKTAPNTRIALTSSDDGIRIIGVRPNDETTPCATYFCAVYDLETQGEVEVRRGIDRIIEKMK